LYDTDLKTKYITYNSDCCVYVQSAKTRGFIKNEHLDWI